MRGKLRKKTPAIIVARITPAGAGKTLHRFLIHRLLWDHPRRCGENWAWRGLALTPAGSPPQVRGKLSLPLPSLTGARITPAGAGKTSLYHLFLSCQPDHPRRCGENSPLPLKVSINTGSPPQVRGKLPYPCRSILYAGITPAGAGKTICKPALDFFAGDHPRRCGENSEPAGKTIVNVGSPPQVRGKLNALDKIAPRDRITPAGAGKTLKYILLCPKWWDHPRRCGENKDPELLLMYILGSPPQVRGKHGTMDAKTLDRGITPAGAGKTHLLDQFHFYLRDHPRRCGENEMQVITARVSEGSPPQVRGKRRGYTYSLHQKRITPAGAGKTARVLVRAVGQWDHPRRCGENRHRYISPPHTCGITPAGAGKTGGGELSGGDVEDHPRRCGENQ